MKSFYHWMKFYLFFSLYVYREQKLFFLCFCILLCIISFHFIKWGSLFIFVAWFSLVHDSNDNCSHSIHWIWMKERTKASEKSVCDKAISLFAFAYCIFELRTIERFRLDHITKLGKSILVPWTKTIVPMFFFL